MVKAYKTWKQEVKKIYTEKYGDKKAKKFLDFISNRYDDLNKVYLPHAMLWLLFDHHMKVTRKNQHQVYGAFGRGGLGKSTLIKNVLWFQDPNFNQSRIASSMDDFIYILYDVLKQKNRGKYSSILIDEPSKATHSASLNWRMTEDVLGQIRQANLFIGVCATELRNVKSSVYSLITAILAFRKHWTYDYYDEERTEGITGTIIKEYKKTNTYEVFHNKSTRKNAILSGVKSLANTPIDKSEKKYLKLKRKEFLNRVKKLKEQKEKSKRKSEPKPEIDPIDKLIIKKKKLGMSTRKIGEHLDMSHGTIQNRLQKLKDIGYIFV